MKKTIILSLIFLLFILNVSAALSPDTMGRLVCERQGYTFEEDFCIFDDGNKCEAYDFYSGKCGNEYIKKDLPCIEKEEDVYKYETCCEGLKPYYPKDKIGGHHTCEPFIKVVKEDAELIIKSPIGIIISITLILIALLIIYLIKRKH